MNTPFPDSLHIADVTMFWGPASGGVRRYLEAKHAHLAACEQARHSLVVPGARARCNEREGQTIRHLPARRLPAGDGYRFPLSAGPCRR